MKIIADEHATANQEFFPLTRPTLTKDCIHVECCYGMPRYDFVRLQWVRRDIEEGVLYKVAMYEMCVVLVADVPVAHVLCRRPPTRLDSLTSLDTPATIGKTPESDA